MSDATLLDATPTREERTWALIAHLGGPAGLLLSAGLFGFLVPLVVWLAKRDDSDFAAHQGKEALNFQLTMFLLHVSAWMFVLLTLGVGILVVWPLFLALWLGALILGVVAAVRAHGGTRFRYPLTLRIVS